MARSIAYPAPECKGPEDKRIITPAGSKALEMADPGAAHLFGSAAEPIATWLAASSLLVAFLALWRGRKRDVA